MRNEAGSAVQKLSTPEVCDYEQRHYTAQRLRRYSDYTGRLSDLDEEKATALLRELLEYFFTTDLNPPPFGLPGANGFKPDAEAMRLLDVGASYFKALIHGEPRRQINLHDRMKNAFEREYERGRKDMMDEIVNREVKQSMAAAKVREEREADVRVYFIGSEMGPIKIGMAIEPSKRLKELQTSHPAKLSILATRAGGQPQERAYHVQFAAHRLHGEWFARCPDILAEIERLAA